MRIALTGATGFIGSSLVPALVEAGHEVQVFSRRPRTGLPPSVRLTIWDPERTPPPEGSLSGWDAVVHLAGEAVSQRWSPEVKRRILASRTDGTRRLVEGLAGASPRPTVVVSASGIDYYGDRGDEVLTEASGPGKGYLPEVCQQWERAAAGAEALGLRVALLRIGLVLGREGGALARMLPPFRAGVGGRLGSGEQWMSWIHIEDLVRLIQFVVSHDTLRGPVNAATPNPVRNSEFTVALGRALRRPAVLPVPLFGLRLLFGEMSEILLASHRVEPGAARQAGFEFHHPEVYAALKDVLG